MNKRMKWKKEYRFGIDAIDSQHRLLFAIANELMDFENPVEEGAEFKYLFNHLKKYVEEHFQFEERFMKEIEFPDLNEHLVKHAEIVEGINKVFKSSRDLKDLKERLETLMYQWITGHILMEDKKYAEWNSIKKTTQHGPEPNQ